MASADALRAAVLADPADDTARLVLADLLREHEFRVVSFLPAFLCAEKETGRGSLPGPLVFPWCLLLVLGRGRLTATPPRMHVRTDRNHGRRG